MTKQRNTKQLSQTDQLIHYLRNGHSTNFLDAFHRFGVQDLRKRLSEIRRLGYRLSCFKEPPTVGFIECSMLRPEQPVPAVLSYKFNAPLKPGHYVKITRAPSVFGVSPLKGKVGLVLSITDDHWHVVGDESGNTFGKFRHRDLLKLGMFTHGQTVRLVPSTFTVAAYDASSGKYLLHSQEDEAAMFYTAPTLIQSCLV